MLGVRTGTRYFLELVDAEDAASVSAVRTDFLAEARRYAGVALGQVRLFDPLVAMESGNGLLGSGNQVLLVNVLILGFLASFADHLAIASRLC